VTTTEATRNPTLRRSWVEVDLGALRHNVDLIRRHVGPDRLIYAVVKSDAYGHGAVPVARAALEAGANALAVATTDEALELRETAPFYKVPILMMGPSEPGEAIALQRARILSGVGGPALLEAHLAAAARLGQPPLVHLQVETGIGRDGFRHDDASPFARLVEARAGLAGIWTHFSMSDDTAPEAVDFTRRQMAMLLDTLALARRHGLNPQVHAANSAAIMGHPETLADAVRPGLMLYGSDPNGDDPPRWPLRQVLSLHTRIAVIRDMPAGAGISYGATWRVPAGGARIATLPIGYGDGLPRRMSNHFDVLVGGRRVPCRGRVCMDQIMVDVSTVPDAAPGDEVVIFGRQGGANISITEAARHAQSIAWEVTCQLTRRLPRVYTNARGVTS
jgi:alanine racemase